MAIYAFRCRAGHRFDAEAPFGQPPAPPDCSCGAVSFREYFVEFHLCDPWRAYHLNKTPPRKLGDNIAGDVPTDKFEARHKERALGIHYIGDNADGLRPNAQRAIEKYGHGELLKEHGG
jgi:hypothetical protein